MNECKRCRERGKTWSGDDPKCAFPKGRFTHDNWNCETMNRMRDIAHELGTTYRDDNSCGSIGYVPMGADYAPRDFDILGGYIVMTWYKERGSTGNAVVMREEGAQELTLQHAELAIRTHEAEKEKNHLRQCPECGFEMHEQHEDQSGGYSCPLCENERLREENERLKQNQKPQIQDWMKWSKG